MTLTDGNIDDTEEMNIDGLDDPRDDDSPQGDPQDAHLGRAAEVQDENWDEAQSSASSK